MRIFIFVFLTMFAFVSNAQNCDALFSDPFREYITEEFRHHRDPHLIDDLLGAMVQENDKEKVVKKMKLLLAKDPYLERALTFPNMSKIVEEIFKINFSTLSEYFESNGILAFEMPAVDKVESIIVDMLVARRERYYKLKDKTPITHPLPQTTVKYAGTRMKLEQTGAINFDKLMDVMPNLDQKWSKSFLPINPTALINLLLVSLKDIPNTVVLIADDIGNLNFILDRVSAWIEAKVFVEGAEMYGYKGAGHDLKAKDIKRYIEFVRGNPNAYVSDDPELQRRLDIEKEFVFGILEPLVNSNPNMIFLAISTDNASKGTLSHEVVHAEFFLDPELRRLANLFFNNYVWKQDKKIFIENLPWYDFAHDQELLVNEFLAHMTQRDNADTMRMSYPKIADLFIKYQNKYLEFLRKNNYSLIR